MNISNFAHAGLALLCQAVVALCLWCFCGFEPLASALMGGLLAVGFYWGREVAQVERHAGTPPWWSGFDLRNWSADNAGDFFTPLVFCALVVVAVGIAF